MKCDHCDNEAVVHEVVIKNGTKMEIHLCTQHAKKAGYTVEAQQQVGQLLSQFVVSHGSTIQVSRSRKTCEECGMSFSEFKKHGVLGCPACYEAFAEQLDPIIERAHAGATHHCGKTPQHAEQSIARSMERRRLMKELDRAVADEEYERAAELRDSLLQLDRDTSGTDDVENKAN